MMQVKRITVKAQTSMSQLKTMNVFETIPPAVQMHSMGISSYNQFAAPDSSSFVDFQNDIAHVKYAPCNREVM